MTILIHLDFETTGLDTKTAHIVEACARVQTDDHVVYSENLFGLPKGISMDPAAIAVNRILPHTLDGKPVFKNSLFYSELKIILENPDNIVVGHNVINYDLKLLDYETKAKVIDTQKVVYYLAWKNGSKLKSASLQYLWALYASNENDEEFRNIKGHAHRARYDVETCYLLYKRALKHLTIEEMIRISSEPTKRVMMPMGQFGPYGKNDIINWLTIREVAEKYPDYVEWLFSSSGRPVLDKYEGLRESFNELS